MDAKPYVTAEERFRGAVTEAAARLGIESFFLGFKDPDCPDSKKLFRGDPVWLVGLLRCAETEIRVACVSGTRPLPPARPESKPGLAPGESLDGPQAMPGDGPFGP